MPANVRLLLVDPATGMVNTGLATGADPKQFKDMAEAEAYMQANGEIPQTVTSEQEAYDIVRQYTGDNTYQGYTDDYQAPTVQPGSPSARGDQWWGPLPTATPPPPPGTDYLSPTPNNGNAESDFPSFETPSIQGITLPDAPEVSPLYGPQFDQMYSGNLDAQTANIGKLYDFQTPMADAAQLDISQIPNVQAQTPEQFEALQFLLSGQGFDPGTLSKMRAGAIDDAAMAGRSNAGSARLAAQQSGLAGSPAGMFLESQANRRQGDQTTRALNDISVADAMQGMQNRQVGAGLEANRQISSASMANQVALQNAAAILQGMQQNVANVQQTNLFNTGNEASRQMTQAGNQANLYGQGSQAYNQGALNRASEADFFNAANQASRGLNQAQLDRQADITNAGNQMQRYGWDTSNLVNLANQAGSNNLYDLGNEALSGLNFDSPWGGLLKLQA